MSRIATTSRRARRSVSAWALPRPSATASAKFANRTVNQSQSDTARMKPGGASPRPVTAAWTKSTVVKALPISTVNMTGFRTMLRGWSLRSASSAAARTIPVRRTAPAGYGGFPPIRACGTGAAAAQGAIRGDVHGAHR